MLTPLKTEVEKVGDLAHEARRFRTILWSFEKNIELLFKGTGLAAEVDHAALAEAFSRWRQNFDQTKHPEAIEAYRLVLQKDPLNKDAPQIQQRIVQAFERDRKLEEAFAESSKLANMFLPGTPWHE